MIKRAALVTFTLATALAMAPSARADSVSGGVAMAGLNTYTGTGINFTGDGHVFMAEGSLSVLLSVPLVTLHSFQFATAPGMLLFDWNHGGTDIKMTIVTLNVLQDTHQFLNTHGTAMISETGFSPTLYDFTLTSTVLGTTSFALDAAPPSAIPEPGSLFLVGSGLLGLAGLLFSRAKETT